MTKLQKTKWRWGGNISPVILTAGMIDGSTGKRIIGVFATAQDARQDNADEFAHAILHADQLTADELATAKRNSSDLAQEGNQ